MSKVITVGRSVIPAGLNTATCRDTPDRSNGLIYLADRPWQPEAFAKLESEDWRRLLAPMGSGKSTVLCALMGLDIRNRWDSGLKALIIVPQTVIGHSYRPMRIVLPDSTVIDWAPRLVLLDDFDGPTIERLWRFVTEPAGPTPDSRVAICTHQTAVALHERLRTEGRKWSCGGPVSLCIDESQLLKQEGEDGEGDNGLGSMAGHWLGPASPGPLTLATATWVRGDLSPLVTKKQLKQLVTYQYTADRYLADMKYLKEIVFAYALGTPEETLHKLLTERPYRCIIDFMRHTNTMTDLGGGKLERRDRRLQVLGPYTPGENIHQHDGQYGRLRSLDLVDEAFQARRKKYILDAIRSNLKASLPNYITTMKIGEMGFDYPQLDTVLIDTKRGSMTAVLQMAGRALRDVLGKTRAEIVTVLDVPDPSDPEYIPKVRDSLKTILGSLVIEWLFRGCKFTLPKLEDPEDEAKIERLVEDFLANPDETTRLVDDLVDERTRSPESRPDTEVIDKVTERVLERLVDQGLVEANSPTEAQLKGALAHVVEKSLERKTKEELHSADDVPDWILDKASSSVFGCLHYSAYVVTHNELARLRTELEARQILPYADLVRDVKRLNIRKYSEYLTRYTEIDQAPKHPHAAGYPEWVDYATLFGSRALAWLGKRARK